jgi:membrane protease YdiL (CAAX protease family)
MQQFIPPFITPAAAAKRGLQRVGNLSAIGLLAFEAIGTVIMLPFGMLSAFGGENMSFLVMLACNGIAAFLALYCVFSGLKKPLGCRDEVGKAFGKPASSGLMLCAVFIGFALAMCSDQLTTWLMWLLNQIGIPTEMPSLEPETLNGANIAMYVVQVAISPALFEEFAFRGVMMQSLRRYGDKFAIVASALVFGVFHGNIVQAPFAFLLGLVMGYLAIATGSVWTAVLIHFANNLNSVLLSIYQQGHGDGAINEIYYAELIIALLAGATALVLFRSNKTRNTLAPAPVGVSKKGRMSAFLLSPAMIILLILLVGNAIASIFLQDMLDILGSVSG